jgi:hypothetical protein
MSVPSRTSLLSNPTNCSRLKRSGRRRSAPKKSKVRRKRRSSTERRRLRIESWPKNFKY